MSAGKFHLKMDLLYFFVVIQYIDVWDEELLHCFLLMIC
jgi:hypothetical protein